MCLSQCLATTTRTTMRAFNAPQFSASHCSQPLTAVSALYHWLLSVDVNICTVYAPFYFDSEVRDISAALSKKVVEGHDAHTARSGLQLLARFGATATTSV